MQERIAVPKQQLYFRIWCRKCKQPTLEGIGICRVTAIRCPGCSRMMYNPKQWVVSYLNRDEVCKKHKEQDKVEKAGQ